ncbi:hypothetical protein Emin_0960 [Elusimicrobium minutum Pei191]|uniref:Uncharacterized protein n=1 Tax=Elusimicrobium minutum (strain Pei191) TaxID=445932 RepID=B2KDB7_ELUMP|nr:hypothetical protein [Elusimicrobium minutum]ACC98513.1 hypothetical protein Emin_0960 [Elusimicrobium minutum Pei191]
MSENKKYVPFLKISNSGKIINFPKTLTLEEIVEKIKKASNFGRC